MKCKLLLLLEFLVLVTTPLLAQSTESYTVGSKVCILDPWDNKWLKGTYMGTKGGQHKVQKDRTKSIMTVGDKYVEPCCEKCGGDATSETIDFTTPLGTWKSFDSPVDGKPNDSPSERMRQFFSFKNSQGNLDVIWQDQSKQKIYLSKFNAGLQQQKQVALPAPAGTNLLAATQDEKGNYYYAVYQNIKGSKAIFYMCKANSNGAKIIQKRHSSAKPSSREDKSSLDIWDISSYPSVMNYQDGQVALFIARRLNKSSDGLNHQSGWAVVFDANTLDVSQNFRQTSGHSFDNYLTTNSAGGFLGIDLGDNYPRGIHLHKFDKNSKRKKSKVVYTFKTYHGTRSTSPAGRSYPRYNEISTAQQTFYQWSNDNGTYTELGGVLEVNDGYMIIFAGEPDPSGKSINNARANGKRYCDTRNLGFVKVRKDYENAQNLKEAIISQGISEKGRFYTFGGKISEQENQGVVWLTKYKNAQTENAMHIKTIAMPDGNILILYSTDNAQDPGYENYQPHMMTVNAKGKIALAPTKLPKGIVISRRDDALLLGNKVIVVQGFQDKDGKGNLRICALDLKGQKGTAQSNSNTNTKPPTPTNTNKPNTGKLVNDLEGKKYYIISADPRAGGRYLDADANGLGKRGTKVQLWQAQESPNQQWKFQKVGDGTYRVLLAASKINGIAYLNADSYSITGNGGKVHLWYNNGDKPNQLWKVTQNANGTYTFTSTDPKANGRCLDASSSSLNTNGGKIQVWSFNNTPNQQWKLIPVPPKTKPETHSQVSNNQSANAGNTSDLNFDENKFYRLTTAWQGEGKSLDIVNDGQNNKIQLASTGKYSGQLWKIQKVGEGYYRLTNQWLGADKSLDIINDGKNNRLQMANTGNYTGQLWKIEKLGNGYYRLTTKWLGTGKSLDVVNDGKNNRLQMANTGNYSGQSWKITLVK